MSQEGEKPTAKTAGHINLDNVSFAYPSRPDILVCRGYQLKIEAGQIVAYFLFYYCQPTLVALSFS